MNVPDDYDEAPDAVTVEHSSNVVRYFVEYIRRSKRQRRRPGEFSGEQKFIFSYYLEEVRKRAAVDLSDLVPLCQHLLQRRPDLRRRYSARFASILVDEYQDVAEDELQLLRQLCGESGRISACGDDDQAVGFDSPQKSVKVLK